MIDDEQRRAGREIQRRTGPTFHVATRLLPPRYREATYVLYGFFRIADDVVDTTAEVDPSAQRAELDRIRTAVLGDREVEEPVLRAVRALRREHDIPPEEIDVFLDAMERDVSETRYETYETYEELETYLRGSAVAVAYMMLAVLDPADREAARPHAKALGEAFQLTNFLRDVKEDIDEYGRVYLPRRTLQAHGVSEDDLASGRFSSGFAAAMRTELERAERLYREGVAGIRYLPEDSQFAILLSAVLYAEHHRLIRANGWDVLSTRPELGRMTRLKLVVETWWRWRRDPDPEAVFYAVSAVSEPSEAAIPESTTNDERRPDGNRLPSR
nr:phytoene/squalene synthase family protein [Halalkalicoccus subterraneus]